MSAGGAGAQEARRLPSITFSDHRLDNGLRVIVATDHSVPIVGVNLWYNVGSKDERPGKTGFAHLFEHFMFQGSGHIPRGAHIAYVQGAGGIANATTDFDRTNYFETMPSDRFELALWLEADRMGTLLDALSQESLDTQRSVVKNEKRQSYDSQPYGSFYDRMIASIFPEGHPYHHTPIGSMEDIEAASLEDVKSFFRTYYAPNNAVLSIVGDVDEGEAVAAAERYFGAIPPNPNIPERRHVAPLPHIGQEVRETVPDRIPLPRVYVGFRTPAFGTKEFDAMQVAIQTLGGGQGNRLSRRLIREEQVAQDVVFDSLNLTEGTSAAFGWATVRPDSDTQSVERVLFEELDRIASEPISDAELGRAQSLLTLAELESLAKTDEVADRLSMFATLFDDPGRINQAVERFLAVTPDDVRAVAADVFRADNRVVLTFVPQPES